MLNEEELEKALTITEKQVTLLRIEQAVAESALEELEKLRKNKEINESLYEELNRYYSQRLNEATKKIGQHKGIVRGMKQFNKYKKEVKEIKQLQEELSTRLEKIDNKLFEEGNELLDAIKSIDLLKEELSEGPILPTDLTSGTERIELEKPEAKIVEVELGREAVSVDENQSEVESLKKEILSELEKLKKEK